jgi:MSHA biogenesis protein MshJ
MNVHWQTLGARYEKLSRREKLIVYVGGIFAFVAIAFAFLDGSWKQAARLEKQVAQSRTETQAARGQAAEAVRRLAQDPNAETQAQIAALRTELERLDRELKTVGRGLVSPERMAGVLQDVVTRNRRVQLVGLKTLPVSNLVEEKKDLPSADIYKHGIEMTLQGSYLDLLDYLMGLERLPFQMFWAQARMDAADYPRVRLTLVLYTLSLDKDWMVV